MAGGQAGAGGAQTKLLPNRNGDRRVRSGYHHPAMTQPPSNAEIDRLLTECEVALAAEDWERLSVLARAVLSQAPEHPVARSLLGMASRGLSAGPLPIPPPFTLPIPPRVRQPVPAPSFEPETEPVAESEPAVEPPAPGLSGPAGSAGPAGPREPVEPGLTAASEREAEAIPARPIPPTGVGGADPTLDDLLRRARVAADAGQWRMAQRFAQAASSLAPDRLDAQRLLKEVDAGLSTEALGAIEAAARRREQQELASSGGRFRLPSFTMQSLRRARFDGGSGAASSKRRRRRVVGLPGLPVELPRVLIPAAAVVLFFLFAGAAFGAFQLMSGDGGDGGNGGDGPSDVLVASTPGTGGGVAGPPPSETATGESTATPEPGAAPVIVGVTCRLLDDELSVECTASVSGEPDELRWSAPGGDPETGTGERFRTALPDGGPYRVQLDACQRDACSAAQSRAFVINDPDGGTPTAGPPPEDDEEPVPDAPVVVVMTCDPEALLTGETVSCFGILSGGEVETYDWSVSGVLVASTATFEQAFETAGARTVSLQVCNEGGCDTANAVVVVQAPPNPEPPVVNLIGCGPLAVQLDETVTCEPTVTGEVETYAWSSGEESGSDETFSVSYATAGTKTIALEACNADGCDSAEASIAVSVAPPAGIPELVLSEASLDFGSFATQQSVTVRNDGDATLEWELVGASPGWISLGGQQSGAVNSGADIFTVSVDRTGLTSGPHSDGLVLVTSNGGSAVVSVLLVKDPTLTVDVAGGVGGEVTPSGTAVQSYNSTVDIVATPDVDYRFVAWSGDCFGTVESTSVLMDGDRTCTATFAEQFLLTVDASPGVGGSPTGSGTFDAGTDAPIGAGTNLGYTFDGWTGCSPANAGAESTTVAVTADTTCTANFVQQFLS